MRQTEGIDKTNQQETVGSVHLLRDSSQKKIQISYQKKLTLINEK